MSLLRLPHALQCSSTSVSGACAPSPPATANVRAGLRGGQLCRLSLPTQHVIYLHWAASHGTLLRVRRPRAHMGSSTTPPSAKTRHLLQANEWGKRRSRAAAESAVVVGDDARDGWRRQPLRTRHRRLEEGSGAWTRWPPPHAHARQKVPPPPLPPPHPACPLPPRRPKASGGRHEGNRLARCLQARGVWLAGVLAAE